MSLESGGPCTVRLLSVRDLDDMVRIDARVIGRTRPEYLKAKLQRALGEGVQVSLGAEIDGKLVGFLMGVVYYGEFGQAEPVATVDTLGVHPDFWGRKVGRAMWDQFAVNLKAFGIRTVRTEVAWTNRSLLGFMERMGFAPAPRLCLERSLDPTRDEE